MQNNSFFVFIAELITWHCASINMQPREVTCNARNAVHQYFILSIDSFSNSSSSSSSSSTVSEIISFLPLWLTGSLLVLLSALALYLRQLSSPLWNCVLRTAEPNGNYWIRGSFNASQLSSRTLAQVHLHSSCTSIAPPLPFILTVKIKWLPAGQYLQNIILYSPIVSLALYEGEVSLSVWVHAHARGNGF